ncbi:MAG: glycerophosphodiester phosphodiesterase family protein [Spirochaetota bacterium]
MTRLIYQNLGNGIRYPLLYAHRGCSTLAPENTLPAFQYVLDLKIPGVELDIHMCKSGEVVVTHDLSLKRVTGYEGLVADTDYETISKLDAGFWFDKKYTGTRIPLLNEVFELLGKNVYYDIEIKHRKMKTGPLEKKLLELISEYDLTERCIISSFNPFALREVRALTRDIQVAIIYSNHEDVPVILRNGEGRLISSCEILKPHSPKVNKLWMFAYNTMLRYPVLPWTVDDEDEARFLLDLGVQGLISNVPEKLSKIILSRQRQDN